MDYYLSINLDVLGWVPHFFSSEVLMLLRSNQKLWLVVQLESLGFTDFQCAGTVCAAHAKSMEPSWRPVRILWRLG